MTHPSLFTTRARVSEISGRRGILSQIARDLADPPWMRRIHGGKTGRGILSGWGKVSRSRSRATRETRDEIHRDLVVSSVRGLFTARCERARNGGNDAAPRRDEMPDFSDQVVRAMRRGLSLEFARACTQIANLRARESPCAALPFTTERARAVERPKAHLSREARNYRMEEKKVTRAEGGDASTRARAEPNPRQ